MMTDLRWARRCGVVALGIGLQSALEGDWFYTLATFTVAVCCAWDEVALTR